MSSAVEELPAPTQGKPSLGIKKKEKPVVENDSIPIQVCVVHPEKPDLKRRIIYLFNHKDTKYYRINYYDPSKANNIVESYFATFENNECKTTKEVTVGPRTWLYNKV